MIWDEKFIVDSKKLANETNEEEYIDAETATSMTCHQPNMEFVRLALHFLECATFSYSLKLYFHSRIVQSINYWNRVHENLIHSYAYVDDPLFGHVYRRTTNVTNHDIFHINRICKRIAFLT